VVELVIADPILKQVTEDVERPGLCRFVAQEMKKRGRSRWPCLMQVQIRNEEAWRHS
jgi:hypothetical protein